MMRALAAALALGLLAGCAEPSGLPETPGPPAVEEVPRGAVVVADIGAGPNFYHEAYRRPAWTEHPATRIPGFPAEARALHLTFGDDYAANVKADQATWDAVEPGLYWVPGTSILWYYHSDFVDQPPRPHGTLHGTASAGAVADACPGCYVLVLNHGGAHEGEGIAFIAEQLPWVDVVAQTGALGNTAGHPAATRALWDTGRLFVGPSGNAPLAGTRAGLGANGVYDGANLPPWIVSVGGSSTACRGVEYGSGAPTDLVSDFVQDLPGTDHVSERVTVAGTSFAAPKAAGVMGQALLEVRRALGDAREPGALWSGASLPSPSLEDGDLTQAELRAAFERAARWFDPADFDPACVGGGVLQFSQPAPAPPSPWTKMGWGHVDAETGPRAARILLGQEPGREPPAEAVAFMDAFRQAREARHPG